MNVEKKSSKPRCSFEGCKKKLKLTDLECTCQQRYCQLHRLPEDHKCSFDFGKKEKELLKNKLLSEKTVAEKIIRI
jgi:predicted nucleic acid binding AN1-type Zn finger protein